MRVPVFCVLGGALFVAALLFARRFGRFSYARAIISLLIGAGCGGACALCFANPAAVTALAFLAVLWSVALIDADTTEIPDVFHPVLLVLGCISCFTMPGLPWWQRLLGMVVVSVPMLLLSVLIDGAFGGGDIKLMFCCGLLLGWKLSLLALFFAILAGGGWGAGLLAAKKAGRGSRFAFGPFLCGGMAVALLAGGRILDWYLSLLAV